MRYFLVLVMNIQFLVIMTSLVLTAIICGDVIKRNKDLSSIIASICIITVYSIIEGLRYMRGVDYLEYVYIFRGFSERQDYLFDLLLKSMHFFNFKYYHSFVFYSFVWISSIIFLLRRYKDSVNIILPLMIISNWYFSENFVRQYLAFSITLISIYYLLEGKIKYFVFLSIIAGLIHSIAFVFALFIYAISYIKAPISIKISIPLYIIGMIMSQSAGLFSYISDIIAKYFPVMSDETTFGHYVSDSDRWFGESGYKAVYSRSLLTTIGNTLFDITLIIIGYHYLEKGKNNQYVLPYNLFVYGAVFFQLFFNYEILRRLTFQFYALWPFLIGLLAMNKKKMPSYIYISYYYLWIYIIAFCFVRSMLFGDDNHLFVWDIIG